jgi:hypothetical protein
MVQPSSGAWRYRTTEELERLHFYKTDHTLHCWSGKQRSAKPSEGVDARECLLGNTYHPGVLAYLLAELFWSLGWLQSQVDISEIAAMRISLQPARRASADSHPGFQLNSSLAAPTVPSMSEVVRFLLRLQTARGGEIRSMSGFPQRGGRYQEVPTDWFNWETVISVPWKLRDNINVAEMRARGLAIRARARRPELHRQRFLHLMDSQVCLNQSAKGRTGSLRMGHGLRRASATLLACGLRDVQGYTRSAKNPADFASRNYKSWKALRPVTPSVGCRRKLKREPGDSSRRRPP